MKRSEVPVRNLFIASFVLERRRAAGLTQSELAELAGVGKRLIVELEAGKQTLRMSKVEQVLRAFGKCLGPVDSPRLEMPRHEAPGGQA